MNVIQLEGEVETTEDCKNLLNEHVSKKNWKRLYKIGDNIRCFTNEDKQFVTIADGIGVSPDEDGEYDEDVSPCAFIGVNIQNEIKAIRNIAKFYYTCDDYGNVYYNPYTKELYIVGSDGGYGYSKTAPKLDKDGDVDWQSISSPHDPSYEEFNTHSETSFITSVVWEAECEPDEVGYMLVGKINQIDF